MSAATLITLALNLLQLVLGGIKGSGAANADAIAQVIEHAIASLTTVTGTPVTYAQLESLRVAPKW